jgi:hypothetical protein
MNSRKGLQEIKGDHYGFPFKQQCNLHAKTGLTGKKGHYGTHFMVTGFNAPKMTDKLQYSLGKVRLDHEKLFC